MELNMCQQSVQQRARASQKIVHELSSAEEQENKPAGNGNPARGSQEHGLQGGQKNQSA